MYVVCVLFVCWYVFFFFKHKTAYEMRISDWSSDVCSSDLGWKIKLVEQGKSVGRIKTGIIVADDDIVRAHPIDEELARGDFMDQIVEIDLGEIFAQRLLCIVVRIELGKCLDPTELIWEEAAAMRDADVKIGNGIERATEDQVGRGPRRLIGEFEH